jgi:cytidyltransferase-like protein
MKVILTGGKFNKIHKGHLWLLKKAKKLGFLVVVLTNDIRNNREYAIPDIERKKLLEKTKIPNKVVIGNKDDFFKVVEKYKPSIIVLGYDQELPKGVKEKLDKKIKIVRFKKYGNYSSRRIGVKRL